MEAVENSEKKSFFHMYKNLKIFYESDVEKKIIEILENREGIDDTLFPKF